MKAVLALSVFIAGCLATDCPEPALATCPGTDIRSVRRNMFYHHQWSNYQLLLMVTSLVLCAIIVDQNINNLLSKLSKSSYVTVKITTLCIVHL